MMTKSELLEAIKTCKGVVINGWRSRKIVASGQVAWTKGGKQWEAHVDDAGSLHMTL